MRRLTMLAIVATLVASSCSSDEATSTTPPSVPGTQADSGSTDPDTDTELSVPVDTEADEPTETESSTTAPTEDDDSTSDPVPTIVDVVTEDDLTLFIAATERALEGTSQESAVFDDPEIYIALGQASCDRFSAGESFEKIATDFLVDIDTDESDDETRLVGAILGAATLTLCPEHADKI
jgi:hypothetical protein